MGRQKAKYPTGSFILKYRKADKDAEVSIYLQYVVNSEPIQMATGIKVSENDWDSKKQCVRTRHKASARLNNQLFKIKEDIDKQIMEYEGRLTGSIVRKMMKGEYSPAKQNAKQIYFIDYISSRNQQRYDLEQIAFATYDNAKYYISQFHNYLVEVANIEELLLSEISVDIIERYKSYCLSRGNDKETINKKLTPIIKGVEYAANNELIPFRLYTTIKELYFQLKDKAYKDEVGDEEVHYLTDEQMQKLVDIYWTLKYPRTRDFIDMFLFSYHACGLRVSDIVTLEWKHIDWEHRELMKNYVKGNVYNRIPLTDAALSILKRWYEKTATKRFVFGLLYDAFDTSDAKELRRVILSKNKTLMTSLKEVGRKLELPFNLTMHVARHSFAVAALERKITLHMISRLMAHSSITTTEKVYAEFLQSTINEEVINRLSFDFLPTDR